MPWPTSADYETAVLNLKHSMGDPELQAGETALNRRGMPMLWAGGFADVYKISGADGTKKWALKCFTRKVTARAIRYRHISQHLKQAKLPFMVDFRYLTEGVRIRGEWYPALKMQWVENGLCLNEFVERYLDRPKMLEALVQLWAKTAGRLREARMAHADLQHGNVLLVPKSNGRIVLRLIDYDGMFVPSAGDIPSAETGHPAFQHPQRSRKGIYSVEVDRFSHLVIYTAIHCLTVGGHGLWNRFNNGDNLLFRKHDFQDPANSEVFHTLWELPDEESRSLVGRLALSCKKPLAQAPLLEEIANGNVLPLTRDEERDAVSILGGTVTSSPVVVAQPLVLPPSSLFQEDLFAEAQPPVEPLSPALPRPGTRQKHSAPIDLSPSGLLRKADGLLKELAGKENGVVHNFLRSVPIIIFLFFLLIVWIMSVPNREKTSEVAKQEPAPTSVGNDTDSEMPAASGLPEEITNDIGMKFRLIPAGEFMMGSLDDDPDRQDDETPQHHVQITTPFYLGIHEVTQEQYEKVMGTNPSSFKGLTHPVEQVFWEGANDFCEKLSQMDGDYDYRLPTEAEWEYACRAGTSTRYSCGDELDLACAWFRNNSNNETHPVGEKRASALGLYGMHGNVWEWCSDWYDSGYYGSSPSADPTGPSTGSFRVHRGGSWYGTARNCRSADRDRSSPGRQLYNLGFRVALVPAERQMSTVAAMPILHRESATAATSTSAAVSELSEDFSERDGIIPLQVAYALKFYKTMNGRLPKSHHEFMTQVIKASKIALPTLKQGERYEYDSEKGKLFIKKQVPVPAE